MVDGMDEIWRDNWSEKSAIVTFVSVMYFHTTSVHPQGYLTSREWSVSPFHLLRGWDFISEAVMNSQ